MKKSLALTILVAILAVGGLLRVLHLNNESLWLDEGVTYYNSGAEDLSGVWDRVSDLDQSPPGYYMVMHYVQKVFGESERAFRLVSVVFGLLSIMFLYLLMAEAFSKEASLIAAFLLAVHPFHIGFSMEARMYVLLSLEALMGFYFLWKSMHAVKRKSYLWWGLFVLSSVAGIYTHNFYFFVLLAFALIFLLLLASVKNRSFQLLLGGMAAVTTIVLYLPWLDNLFYQLGVERYWLAEVEWSELADYYLNFADWNLFLMFGGYFLIVLGAAWVIYKKKKMLAYLCFLVFILAGLVVPMAYSVYFEPVLKIRYVVYILPILLGLVALGMDVMRKVHPVFVVLMMIAFVSVTSPQDLADYPAEFGEDFRAIVEVIENDPAEVIVHTPSLAHVMNFYGSDSFQIRPYPESDDLREYAVGASDKKAFQKHVAGLDGFYLVISHSHEKPGGLLEIWSDELCQSFEELDANGMRVWRVKGC
ncbi:glycosyltransferase family 39 protein [Candidatus Gracilibacteria bacterium]|nr:glycosyltransferase family 39 protein [Candidatus Gracilibacteria bacterium]